jgi:hypothetical protein
MYTKADVNFNYLAILSVKRVIKQDFKMDVMLSFILCLINRA